MPIWCPPCHLRTLDLAILKSLFLGSFLGSHVYTWTKLYVKTIFSLVFGTSSPVLLFGICKRLKNNTFQVVGSSCSIQIFARSPGEFSTWHQFLFPEQELSHKIVSRSFEATAVQQHEATIYLQGKQTCHTIDHLAWDYHIISSCSSGFQWSRRSCFFAVCVWKSCVGGKARWKIQPVSSTTDLNIARKPNWKLNHQIWCGRLPFDQAKSRTQDLESCYTAAVAVDRGCVKLKVKTCENYFLNSNYEDSPVDGCGRCSFWRRRESQEFSDHKSWMFASLLLGSPCLIAWYIQYPHQLVFEDWGRSLWGRSPHFFGQQASGCKTPASPSRPISPFCYHTIKPLKKSCIFPIFRGFLKLMCCPNWSPPDPLSCHWPFYRPEQ